MHRIWLTPVAIEEQTLKRLLDEDQVKICETLRNRLKDCKIQQYVPAARCPTSP